MNRFICEVCFKEVEVLRAENLTCCGRHMVTADEHFYKNQSKPVPVEVQVSIVACPKCKTPKEKGEWCRFCGHGRAETAPSPAVPAGSKGQAVREYNGPALFPR